MCDPPPQLEFKASRLWNIRNLNHNRKIKNEVEVEIKDSGIGTSSIGKIVQSNLENQLQLLNTIAEDDEPNYPGVMVGGLKISPDTLVKIRKDMMGELFGTLRPSILKSSKTSSLYFDLIAATTFKKVRFCEPLITLVGLASDQYYQSLDTRRYCKYDSTFFESDEYSHNAVLSASPSNNLYFGKMTYFDGYSSKGSVDDESFLNSQNFPSYKDTIYRKSLCRRDYSIVKYHEKVLETREKILFVESDVFLESAPKNDISTDVTSVTFALDSIPFVKKYCLRQVKTPLSNLKYEIDTIEYKGAIEHHIGKGINILAESKKMYNAISNLDQSNGEINESIIGSDIIRPEKVTDEFENTLSEIACSGSDTYSLSVLPDDNSMHDSHTFNSEIPIKSILRKVDKLSGRRNHVNFVRQVRLPPIKHTSIIYQLPLNDVTNVQHFILSECSEHPITEFSDDSEEPLAVVGMDSESFGYSNDYAIELTNLVEDLKIPECHKDEKKSKYDVITSKLETSYTSDCEVVPMQLDKNLFTKLKYKFVKFLKRIKNI